MSLRLDGAQLIHSNGCAALRGVNLEIQNGEQLALIGPSGAGKSSLLQLMASAVAPSSGQVQLWGQNPWQLSARARQKLRRQIGLIHQAPPLPPKQRVVTAVLAGRLGQWSLAKSLLSLIYPQDCAGARQQLAKLELADKLFAQCGALSGGQLQRVGIARVLYQNPRLWLADEPVSAMDPRLAQDCLTLLCAQSRARCATLVTSLHSVELALAHFPRIIGVREGRIAFDCPASQVSPVLLERLYAGESAQPVPQETRNAQSIHCPC